MHAFIIPGTVEQLVTFNLTPKTINSAGYFGSGIQKSDPQPEKEGENGKN